MHIMILDDDAFDRLAFKGFIEEWADADARDKPTLKFALFSSSEDLLKHWTKHPQVDILFLDIQIPKEINGMEIAQRIRAADKRVIIIFVSHCSEYASDGYELSALWYLNKPVSKEMVFKCMNRALDRLGDAQEQGIPLEATSGPFMLYPRELRSIEVKKNYLNLSLSTLSVPVTVRMPLKQLLALLPQGRFVQCHRSFAVNLRYVRRFTLTEAVLTGDEAVPLGEKYLEQARSAFSCYSQGDA